MPERLRVLAAPAAMPVDGNPYITSLYAELRALGVEVAEFNRRALLDGYSIVHVHWPELLVRWAPIQTAIPDVAKVLGGLWLARRRGARLVWTGHDLGPHDMPRPRLYRLYIALFTRMVDGLISLGPSATKALLDRYPALRRAPNAVILHGDYRHSYRTGFSRADARRELGLPPEQAVLLLLGQVRRYKNVPALIRHFLGANSGAHLAVTGEVRGDAYLADEITAVAAGASNVTTRLSRVPTADVATWHAAADVVVLPYSQKSSLHSGAALLALSMNKPVVVPESGTMRELQEIVGAEWVYTFTGGVDEALEAALRALSDGRASSPPMGAFEWERIGQNTLNFYEGLLA